jgi:hypothetical protein
MAVMTRKDIARRVGVSTDIIRRNEARLGLQPVKVNARLVVYNRKATVRALRARGLA